jgi:AcrR family transcriptional regulator
VDVTGVRKLTPEMRRDQIRTYLLEAAAAVFAARGFHGATLDEIAQAAGFTKGAIYSNFGSKEDLFLALVEQREQAMLEQFFSAAAPGATTAEVIEAVSEVYRRLTPTTTEWALWEEFLLYSLRNPELRAKLDATGKAAFAALVAMVGQRFDEAGVTPPVAVEDMARLYLAIFDGLARQRALNPDEVPDDLFARLGTFVNDAAIALGTPTAATVATQKPPRARSDSSSASSIAPSRPPSPRSRRA